MVQAASPNSCILDPVFSCATAICQQVYNLIDKIACFVFSIFTAIGEFVKSYLCCSSSQSAISTTTTQSITTSSTQPATPTVTLVTEPFLRAGPSPTGVSPGGKAMLRQLTKYLCQNEPISRDFLDKHMQTPEKAQQFFARLIGYLGVMCQDSKIFACSFLPSIIEDELKQNMGEYIGALTERWQHIQWEGIDLAHRDLFLENLPMESSECASLNTTVNQFIEGSSMFRQCADATREAYLAAKAAQTATVSAPRDPETLRQEQESSLFHDEQYCYSLQRHWQHLPANLSATGTEKKACAQIVISDLVTKPSMELPHFMRREIPSSESAIFTTAATRRSEGRVWYHGLITALRREFADFPEFDKPTIIERLQIGSLTGLDPSTPQYIFMSKARALAEILCKHNQGFNAAAEAACHNVLESN